MSDKPKAREYTQQEVRDNFLRHVRAIVDYWSNQPGKPRDHISGCAFSILVALDGGSAEFPGFRVIPYPHPDDKSYCQSQGENWYPNDGCDIAGCLHEYLFRGWR